MFDIESVDEFVKNCAANGIEIAVPPRVYPLGTKEVVVNDPDGVILVFREKNY